MSTSYTAKGDEQGNPKQIYSTDEIKTGGVWIDGKPIYRKVFVGNGNYYFNEDVIATIPNMGSLIYMGGEILTDGSYSNNNNTDSQSIFFKRVGSTQIYLYNNLIDSTSNYELILEYTKITD